MADSRPRRPVAAVFILPRCFSPGTPSHRSRGPTLRSAHPAGVCGPERNEGYPWDCGGAGTGGGSTVTAKPPYDVVVYENRRLGSPSGHSSCNREGDGRQRPRQWNPVSLISVSARSHRAPAAQGARRRGDPSADLRRAQTDCGILSARPTGIPSTTCTGTVGKRRWRARGYGARGESARGGYSAR